MVFGGGRASQNGGLRCETSLCVVCYLVMVVIVASSTSSGRDALQLGEMDGSEKNTRRAIAMFEEFRRARIVAVVDAVFIVVVAAVVVVSVVEVVVVIAVAG